MTKVSVQPVNLNKNPHLPAYPLQTIEIGTFVTLLNDPNIDNKPSEEISESRFYLLPKGNKGLIISKNKENSTVLVMKFSRTLGDGEVVNLPFNHLAIKLKAEELILLAEFRY